MRPTVSQFLTLLVSFAETGPVFVSGKIRSIELNIQQIAEGKADGDTLVETAEQVRNLLEHVRNTGTNIRDIMESLSAEITMAQYVQRFFNDYIERVFIGDYRELKTREHPRSHMPQILRIVEDLYGSDNHRTRLIAWYEAKRCSGDRHSDLPPLAIPVVSQEVRHAEVERLLLIAQHLPLLALAMLHVAHATVGSRML